MNSTRSKAVSYLSNAETDRVSRILLSWLNQFPDKPVQIINFENLEADTVSMALSTVQSTYITKRDIFGGYQAQYQFNILYRVHPSTNNDRLSADELLNTLGDWAASREQKPELSGGARVVKIECNTRATLLYQNDDGSEDHQILMTMTYEVI